MTITREEAVRMDRAATLMMLRHHPRRASDALRMLVQRSRERAKPTAESKRPASVRAPVPSQYPDGNAGPVAAKTVVAIAAARHGLTVAEIRSPSRKGRLVRARHEVMYQLARLTGHSTVVIGRMLGGRDHTSVLHGIRAHMARTGAPSVRGLSPLPLKRMHSTPDTTAAARRGEGDGTPAKPALPEPITPAVPPTAPGVPA